MIDLKMIQGMKIVSRWEKIFMKVEKYSFFLQCLTSISEVCQLSRSFKSDLSFTGMLMFVVRKNINFWMS